MINDMQQIICCLKEKKKNTSNVEIPNVYIPPDMGTMSIMTGYSIVYCMTSSL
jgi:hypothetical protein